MKLLEAEKIEDIGKDKGIQHRIDALRQEESQAVRDFNNVKTKIEEEKQRIEKETAEIIVVQKKRAEDAKREADSVESFRKDVLNTLLKPVGEMEKEAGRRLKIAEQKELEVKRDLESLWNANQILKDKESELNEREKKIMKIANEFDEREKTLQSRLEIHARGMAQRERRAKEELNRAKQILEEVKNKKWRN